MKILKYIIVALTLLILILIAIFGIDIDVEPQKATTSVPVLTEQEVETDVVEELPELEEIKLELTEELVQTYPFLGLLPAKAVPFDVNRNGIRDDIEIYAAQKFPHSPKMRAVYIQVSKAVVRSYLDEGRTKTARQVTLFRDEELARKCFLDSGFTEEEFETLMRLLLIDKKKVRGYQNTQNARKEIPEDLLASIELPEDSCDPILMENERMLQSWSPDKQ